MDVVGFTSLTETFASRGPVGAEELSEILNAYFGKLTDIILQHGGDVVLFAGDAVLAVWPAHDNDLDAATLRAAQCALAIARELHQFTASEVTLVQRTAVGAGQLSYLEVGGEARRWQPLLAGDAIAQLGPTRKLARPGEVLVSAEAWPRISRHARGEVLEYGEARLDAIDANADAAPIDPPFNFPSSDVLRAYVPDVVLQRLEAGHGEWIAEFRPVVVVYIQISGVEYRTAGTLGRLQNVMLAVQRPLQHHEGAIYQFLMDDKGTSIVAAFGLPHHAQEQEAQRAVSAALAIHDALSGMAVRASIGIAAGRAFCGAYGSKDRRQYSIVGPVINLAARLSQPASGGILCDEATQRQSRQRIRFEELPPVTIKGRAGPVVVYRPTGRVHSATGDGAVFIGRDPERRLLEARVERALEQNGGIIGIVGEAGIGKSFLLRHVLRFTQALGVRVLTSAGDAMERATSYYAWRELLTQLLAPAADTSTEQLRAEVLLHLSDNATLLSWAPLLNAILPLGLPDNEVTSDMESEARTDSVQAIVTHLLERLTRDRPVAIAIDDFHWLDSASLALLQAAALRVPRVLIIVGTRPLDDATPAGMQRLLRSTRSYTLRLEPLSRADTDAMVCQRLGVAAVPVELATFIQQRAEGHPFYTDELTLALREVGLIAVEDGVCRVVSDLQAANFPDSVQAVVNSRIDRLQPLPQLALKTASVIGRAFPFNVLHDTYPVEPDRPGLRGALKEFERADIARMEIPEPNLTYLFRHAITQEAAYNSLLFSQRRQLHERIARWYETHYASNLAPHFALLAHHWDRAEVTDKAVEYLEKAGVEAFNAFSSQECVQFFNRAQQVAARRPGLVDVHRQAEWERYIGDAYQHMTDYEKSEQHLKEALRLIGRPMPSSRFAMSVALMREMVRQAFHRIAPKRVTNSARGELARDLSNATILYRGYLEIFFFRSEPLGVLYGATAVLNCGERTGQLGTAAMGAGAIAYMCATLGLGRLRDFYMALGVSYAKKSGTISDVAYVEGIQTTLVNIASGRWEDAEASAARGLEGFARAGYRVRWELILGGWGFVLQLRGRFADAMRAFNDVYASARGSRPQTIRFARYGQLAVGLSTGSYNDSWVSELTELTEAAPPLTEVTTSYGLIAQAHLRNGDTARAWAMLEKGLGLMTAHPPAAYFGLGGFAMITATYLEMLEAGTAPVDAVLAGRRAKQACALLNRFSLIIKMARPRAALYTGWYDALRGRHTRAISRLYKGLASARKQRLPYDEGLLHFELARRLPASDVRRAQHLAECTRCFNDLGAIRDLRRAEELAQFLTQA